MLGIPRGWGSKRICSIYFILLSGFATEETRLCAGCALPLEFDFDQFAVFIRDLEHVPSLQPHKARDEDIRDLPDAGVVGVDVVVEKLATVGDVIFDLGNAGLQLEEIFVGSELRIIFGNCEKAA